MTNEDKILDDLKKGVVEDVKPEIREQVTAVSKEMVDETVKRLKEELPLRKDFNGSGSDDAAKAEERNEQLKDFKDLVKAVAHKDISQAKTISAKYATKALSEGTDSAGGYTVPTVLLNEISRLIPQVGKFRADATVLPVQTNKLTIPTVGSVTVTRTGEGVAKTASQPTFGKVDVVVKKIAAIIPLTDELIEDSPQTLLTLMGQLGAEAMAKYEDEWGFLGKAAGEGIFQNTSVPVYTLATGKDTYAEMDVSDALAAIGTVDEAVLPGAKWYMSFSVLASLWGKKDSNGQFLVSAPTEGRPATLFGFPIETVNVLPKTSDASQPGTKFMVFGNLKGAVIADRQQLTIDVSNEASITDTDGSTAVNLWQQDMTAIRLVKREDIVIPQPTSFVVVKTAAS